MKVADVMTAPVVTVGPDTSWKRVAELMLEAGVSGLPVVDEQGYLLGVVTEGDLVSRPAFGERRHRSLAAVVDYLTGDARWTGKAGALTAADLMTTAVITACVTEDIGVVARRMLEQAVKRLPVLDGGRLVGIVSRRDLLWAFHRPDATIARDIVGKLNDARYAPEDNEVEVSVEDGVVTLDGWVRTNGDLPVVESLVRGVPGVVQVVSRLTFRQRVPA